MRNGTLPRFWRHCRQLPKEVQELANKSFELLKADPYHPYYTSKGSVVQGSCGQRVLAPVTGFWVWRSQRASCGSGSVATPTTIGF